ncbi:MAG: NADH:ubiquinone reductase (Na(+)-transporting) subunit A, partial [Bacteroidales bacterium]|nr:NADH:ubiquinone reductase (Na(+)-transporting) subunit A [Bacteroidales bacterium]
MDIKLKQNDFNESVQPVGVTRFAVKPTDFYGLVPRLLVREGDTVRAGDALFADNGCPEVRIFSPVS